MINRLDGFGNSIDWVVGGVLVDWVVCHVSVDCMIVCGVTVDHSHTNISGWLAFINILSYYRRKKEIKICMPIISANCNIFFISNRTHTTDAK